MAAVRSYVQQRLKIMMYQQQQQPLLLARLLVGACDCELAGWLALFAEKYLLHVPAGLHVNDVLVSK